MHQTKSKHSSHFEGRNALQHVLDTKAKAASSEPHGIEIPGHLFAATDTSRFLSLLIMILFVICSGWNFDQKMTASILGLFSLGALIGLAGRSAWIGWARLERLHRVLQQEHYEIEHHRQQEREELRALYSQKGFEDPLLEQVVDVLMADDEKLLRVMLEEEMGFSLESYEHPLKQCFGAIVGGIVTIVLSAIALYLFPRYGLIVFPLLLMGISSGLSSYFERNRMISSIIWSLSIGGLSLGVVYFLITLLKRSV